MKEIREQEQDKSKVQELTKTYYDNEYKPAYMAMLKDFIDKNQDNYIGAFALQNLSNFMNPEEMESIIAQSSAFIQSRNIIRKLSQRITNLKRRPSDNLSPTLQWKPKMAKRFPSPTM